MAALCHLLGYRALISRTLERQVIRRVHPVDARIDMLLVQRSDLKNPCHPVSFEASFVRLIWIFIRTLLPLNRRIIGDVDETVAIVLNLVDYTRLAVIDH